MILKKMPLALAVAALMMVGLTACTQEEAPGHYVTRLNPFKATPERVAAAYEGCPGNPSMNDIMQETWKQGDLLPCLKETIVITIDRDGYATTDSTYEGYRFVDRKVSPPSSLNGVRVQQVTFTVTPRSRDSEFFTAISKQGNSPWVALNHTREAIGFNSVAHEKNSGFYLGYAYTVAIGVRSTDPSQNTRSTHPAWSEGFCAALGINDPLHARRMFGDKYC